MDMVQYNNIYENFRENAYYRKKVLTNGVKYIILS